MNSHLVIWVMLIVPVAAACLAVLQKSGRWALRIALAGAGIELFLGLAMAKRVFSSGAATSGAEWLRLDELGAYNLVVMLVVYFLSSVYALFYFDREIAGGKLGVNRARMFAGLWCGALGAMTLVFVSNNLGIMWVGIEATTLLTAPLISVHLTRESLEAMWKYILICSVGVAFAFMGTLLVAAGARSMRIDSEHILFWTELRRNASVLDPAFVKAGFVFLLVGYGTKAGLAPMHNWLPDAHSQAPTPVSAIFSGFMLNAALYCVMRYVPIIESVPGLKGWSSSLLVLVGTVSILVAAVFILAQHDLKRLLAYHSVEHMGIITLGLGLGGIGTFAALFHTLNHSLCKTVAFFTAGRLGQACGTHNMTRLSGSMRLSIVWGGGLFCSILVLIGVAPFAIFMSEFQILKAAADNHATVVAVLFLVGCGIVFVGALGHAIPLAWGDPGDARLAVSARPAEVAIVFLPLAVLLVLGLWMPAPFKHALLAAADVIRQAGAVSADSLFSMSR